MGKNNEDGVREVFCSSINIQAIISVTVFIITEVAGLILLFKYMAIPDGRLTAAFWVFQCSVLTMVVNTMSIPYNAMIIAKEKMTAFAYIDIVNTVLKLLAVLILQFMAWDKLILYAILMLAIQVGTRYIYTAYCNKHFNEVKYKYHWNDGNALANNDTNSNDSTSDLHWKSEIFLTAAPGNTYGYIYNNYNTGPYIVNHYNFDPNITYTKQYDYTTSNTLPTGENVNLVQRNGTNHKNKAYYFTGYCSSAIITGIWYTYSIYKTGNNYCTSLHAKREQQYAYNFEIGNNGNGYYGVHTPEFTYYTIEDLVRLDGVLTKATIEYNNNGYYTVSNDEQSIVSAIISKMLSETEGKKVILKAIANYGKINQFAEAVNKNNHKSRNIPIFEDDFSS